MAYKEGNGKGCNQNFDWNVHCRQSYFFLPINVSFGRWLGMAYKEGYFKGCNEIREHLLNPTMLNANFVIQ